MSISGLAPLKHLMQTAGQGLAEHAMPGAEHLASHDVTELSTQQAEKPGFFQKISSVLKEMGHIIRRSVGIRTPEEIMALRIAHYENQASHDLNAIIQHGDMTKQSKEAIDAYKYENANRLLQYALPGLNEIFLKTAETKLQSLSTITEKQMFIAGLEKLVPHIELEKPEQFATSEEKELFKQGEACIQEFRNHLAVFCHLNKGGTGLHSKLNSWLSHYEKIQDLDNIDFSRIHELIDHKSIPWTAEEKKELKRLDKENPKDHNLKLVQTLSHKLQSSDIEAFAKGQYEQALKEAECRYKILNASSFKFSPGELTELKAYLSDNNAREHVNGIIMQRMQEHSDTRVPSQQLLEAHYKSFETFLKHYEDDYAKSGLPQLSASETESLRRLRKSFDTSTPWGTEGFSKILSLVGMRPDESKTIAANIARIAHNQAKGWAVNSVLGRLLRPVMGERGTGFVTTATLSTLSGMRPGEALRHTGTSFIIDHFANRMLEGKHPSLSMGWGFFGRDMVISKLHEQLGQAGFRKFDDQVSAGFSQFWNRLTQ